MNRYPPNVHKALDGVVFIANHLASADDSRRVLHTHAISNCTCLCVLVSLCAFGLLEIGGNFSRDDGSNTT